MLAGLATTITLTRSSGRAEPDPRGLLLDAADYAIPGLRGDPRLQSAFSQPFGTGDAPRETDLAACLHLPIAQIKQWQASAVYSAGTPIGEPSGGTADFDAAQSAALVRRTTPPQRRR